MIRLMRPQGPYWYLEGNTFTVRTQLKALGAQWRPGEKAWVVAQGPQAEEALVALGFQKAIPLQAVVAARGAPPVVAPAMEFPSAPLPPSPPGAPLSSPGAPEVAAPTACLTVKALLTHLRAVVAKACPQALWVEGDVQDLNRRKGHYFFQLVDTPEEGAVGRPWLVRCALWQGRAQQMDPNVLSILQEGVRVRIQAHVELRVEGGDVTLQVTALDPRLTLGELALRRRAVVADLQKRGLYTLNKQKALAPLPLTIALITSPEGRAVSDFIHELQLAKVGFVVHVLPATVQGPQTSPSVCAALREAQALQPDVVVITRGGGSRVDLHWFDDLEICKSIAYSPVPVVTAIGHFEDVSVADEVAWRGEKTPTGAARFLTNHVAAQWQRAQDRLDALSTRIRHRLQGAQRDLANRATWVATRAHMRLQKEGLRCQGARERLAPAVQRRLSGEAQKLAQAQQVLTMARRALQAPLARGYALIEGPQGRPLGVAALLALPPGTPLDVVVQSPAGDRVAIPVVTAPRENDQSGQHLVVNKPL